jgi:cobalt/nickel transport system permease protein
MHISDGIISVPVCLAANAASIIVIYQIGKKTEPEEIPKMGMMGAALFVVSLVHFPLAGTSIHLGLFGLAGIILGKRAFPVIFTALLLQSLIFQHGGLLTLGVNSINMGAGALVAMFLWRWRILPEYVRALLAGFMGIIIPAILMGIEFQLSGYGRGIVYLLSIYLLAALVEAGITFSIVKFFRNVKPDILIS